MSIALPLGVGAVSAFIAWTALFNIRGSRVEKALVKARGAQNVESFVEMFTTDSERAVAKALYPRLERLTFTRELTLWKDDRLFSVEDGDLCSVHEVTTYSLNFDDEGLFEDVLVTLRELGCDVPKTVVVSEMQRVETVEHLVSALANLLSHQP